MKNKLIKNKFLKFSGTLIENRAQSLKILNFTQNKKKYIMVWK